MRRIGFVTVSVATQVFFHAQWLVLVVIHGDDFMAGGAPRSLDLLDEALGQFFILKVIPRVGPADLGGTSRGVFTKRVVAFENGAFVWRADQQHIDKIIEYCCGDKKAPERQLSPGSKHVGKSARDSANELEGERRNQYRSLVPTAHYVAADRPDIQYTTGVLMRSLETPLIMQELQLFRLGSYLKTVPTLSWVFKPQEQPKKVYTGFRVQELRV